MLEENQSQHYFKGDNWIYFNSLWRDYPTRGSVSTQYMCSCCIYNGNYGFFLY